MAKKKKANIAPDKKKLVKALETLKSFKSESSVEGIITVTDSFQIRNIDNNITFSLIFNTTGVGATTDAVLHDINSGDEIIVSGARDSLFNFPVRKGKIVNTKFLIIKSIVTATDLTPVPINLKAIFYLSDGVQTLNYAIPEAKFTQVGGSVIIDISIFFYQP